jgi:hypothetical protein
MKRGKPRDIVDLLLGFDEESLHWRQLVAEQAVILHSAVPSGSMSPRQRDIWARITHPELGDYVYEASTLYLRHGEDGKSVGIDRQTGYLHAITEMPVYTEAEWNAEQLLIEADGEARQPYSACPTEEVWVVRNGPGADDLTYWHNAIIRVIPLSRELFR